MNKGSRHSFLYRNSLSLALLGLMIIFLAAQLLTGYQVYNDEREDEGAPPAAITEYVSSGHFIQATFENWESEFLQMAIYVLLTVSLRQAGSSESKKLDVRDSSEKPPEPRPDSPWPVKKGGVWLKLYENSLSLGFLLLFLMSFVLHFNGSLKDYNEHELMSGGEPASWPDYLMNSRFWFESFQNWQSEFLAVASIVLLSIWLRQKGSPESKPVDASFEDTGK